MSKNTSKATRTEPSAADSLFNQAEGEEMIDEKLAELGHVGRSLKHFRKADRLRVRAAKLDLKDAAGESRGEQGQTEIEG